MKDEIIEQPALPMELPPRPGAEWREHTAERWKEREPEAYAECLWLIRQGLVNQSELARTFGVSRNTIQAVMMSGEFERGEINLIIQRAALLGTAQMMDKMMELTEKTKSTKDLGAVSMGLTTMHNINQIHSGGPTEIKVHHHRFSVDDFEEARRKRLNDGGTVVDVVDQPASPREALLAGDTPLDIVEECVKVARAES